MKNNIFVDTNVALDLLAERIPFFDVSLKLFSFAESGVINIIFSSLGFSTIDYLLSKQIGKLRSKTVLRKFKQIVSILSVDERIIENALNSDFTDFEDAIQYEVAKENQQEVIISRNTRDFKRSEIPVFTPEEYLKLLNDSFNNH
ncbi:MAG: PIN domain-containing protein [Bacteroidota bacterium]|nr:PIN domain-containing protein [Bacteroidota bacterium]